MLALLCKRNNGMKTKLTLLLLLCLFSVPALAAEKESAYDRVMRTGTIRCGYGISPPNLVRDENKGILSGLDYDVWQEIEKALDLKVEFTEEAGWGNFIEGLKTGRYDAFCSMLWPDAGRTRFLSLSQPVLYSFLRTYVRSDDHRFDGNLEKLNAPDVTIPAIEGDISVTMAETRFPKARTLALPQTATVSDMFMAVTSKKADAIFVEKAMFDLLNKENKGVLRELEKVPNSFVFASRYGFAAKETQLRDMVDVVLQTMIDDGKMEMLVRKYIPDGAVPKRNY
jgi:ABC-type amino acid transport substrate-binding protein